MLKSRLSSPSASAATGAQAIHGMCNTCAAVDRDLQKPQETPEYLDIFSLSAADMLCFECVARLRGFSRFRRRALRVREALSNVTNYMDKTFVVPCLSTLTKVEPEIIELPEFDTSQMPTVSPDSEADTKGSLVVLLERISWPEVEVNMPVPEFEVNIPVHKVEGNIPVPKVEMKMPMPKVEVNIPVPEIEVNMPVPKVELNMPELKVEVKDEVIEFVDDALGRTERFAADNVEESTKSFYKEIPVDASEVRKHFASIRSSVQFKNSLYKCAPCAHTFKSKEQFMHHQQCHSERQGRFECPVCQQRFASLELMENHNKLHNTQYKCLRCEQVFDNHDKVRMHYTYWHDSKPRKCSVCNALFTSYAELKKHKRIHTRFRYSCDVCIMTYRHPSELERHKLMSHTKVPQVECEICHKKYKGALNLQHHMQTKHKSANKVPDENAYCAECDMQFKDIYCYRQHLHSLKHCTPDDYRYECDYCGNKYTQKSGVLGHIMRMHLKIKLYPCDLCRERFYSTSRRTEHKRLVHGCGAPRKTYVCQICDKIFKFRKSHKDHMNVHLGVRPYQCKICGAAFAHGAVLYTHNKLVHLKIKKGKRKTS